MDAESAYEVALETALMELLEAVASVSTKTSKFRTQLKRLHKTLRNIQPILYGKGRLRIVLDRAEIETKMFIICLENGKKLVLNCSMIKRWNVYKKLDHVNKLIRLDHELSKFFQVELQSIGMRTLTEIHDLGDTMDQVLSTVTNRDSVSGLPDFIVGFDVHLQELKRLLLDNANQVLTVSAPGGCGKTTLAKMLCHDDEIKGIFGDNIFYVTVSRTTSYKTIVEKLFAHHLHVNNCEFQNDEDAKNQLQNMMSQIGSEKILLVLDDVWPESESIIQDLKFAITGYKILITSRFMFSDIGSTYELSLLNDEDARTLLYHLAFVRDGNQINVPDDLVIEMVKCCKGFPLALTVIGASLCGHGVLNWRTILKKLSEGQSIFDSNSELLISLRASVDALEYSPTAHNCFLDLGSFPKDEKIAASVFMDMWVELYNLDKEGMYTCVYLLELFSRNLLNLIAARKDARELEGHCNEHYVTQHDLLRELAIHMSIQEAIPQRKRLMIEIHANEIPAWWNEQTQQQISTRLMSITTDETFASVWYDLNAPKVEVLVLNTRGKNYKLPHFIRTMKELKSLIITSYGIYPTELHELFLISSLSNLKRMRLENLSFSPSFQSISQLKNLQKLSFIMCEISNALDWSTVDSSMLPNLTELEINNCYYLIQVPATICDLVHLEKLSITNCHDLDVLPEELGNLSNLEILRLHSCTRLTKLPDSIGKLHNLKFLDISNCLRLNSLPDQIGELNALRVINNLI